MACSGYRVELWRSDMTEVLGELPAGTPAHHQSLAPFAIQLRLEGAPFGILALVDEATGEVVARRHLAADPREQGGTSQPAGEEPSA